MVHQRVAHTEGKKVTCDQEDEKWVSNFVPAYKALRVKAERKRDMVESHKTDSAVDDRASSEA